MESLKRIENLPPAQRGSRVGQAGVLSDLKSLQKDEAIEWLKSNISSPVTRDWGRLLFALSVDWDVLKEWMQLGKAHALAALDAIDHYLAERDEWPPGGRKHEVVSEIEHLLSLYQTPKVKQVYDEVLSFANPPPLTKNLALAAQILFGSIETEVVLRDKSTKAKWHSLLHKADKKYCLIVLDWKASTEEVANELSSLPIISQAEAASLTYQSLDIGSDETIVVVLPGDDLMALKKLAPKSFRFESTEIRPNQ